MDWPQWEESLPRAQWRLVGRKALWGGCELEIWEEKPGFQTGSKKSVWPAGWTGSAPPVQEKVSQVSDFYDSEEPRSPCHAGEREKNRAGQGVLTEEEERGLDSLAVMDLEPQRSTEMLSGNWRGWLWLEWKVLLKSIPQTTSPETPFIYPKAERKMNLLVIECVTQVEMS